MADRFALLFLGVTAVLAVGAWWLADDPLLQEVVDVAVVFNALRALRG